MATVRCPECGFVFRQESALRDHLATYHPGLKPDEPEATQPPAIEAAAPEAEAPATAPAGWYPNPTGEGQRYWDGSAWLDATTPAEPAVKTRWIVLGYVGAVVFPIVGLIVGAYLITKGLRGHGIAVVLISVAIGAAGVLISSSDDSGGSGDRILEHSRDVTDRCLHAGSPHEINKCIKEAIR
jgi:hypothetical protein